MKPADIATGVIAIWALGALALQQPQPQPRNHLRPAAATQPTLTAPHQLPDRRTLSQFPGP